MKFIEYRNIFICSIIRILWYKFHFGMKLWYRMIGHVTKKQFSSRTTIKSYPCYFMRTKNVVNEFTDSFFLCWITIAQHFDN